MKWNEQATTSVKSLRIAGVNWEPPSPEGEDKHSMKQHRNALKREWKKKSPGSDKIKQRMDITYSQENDNS